MRRKFGRRKYSRCRPRYVKIDKICYGSESWQKHNKDLLLWYQKCHHLKWVPQSASGFRFLIVKLFISELDLQRLRPCWNFLLFSHKFVYYSSIISHASIRNNNTLRVNIIKVILERTAVSTRINLYRFTGLKSVVCLTKNTNDVIFNLFSFHFCVYCGKFMSEPQSR